MEVLELKKESLTETADQLFERIYEPGFVQVARFISKNGGTFEDAKDIFHDALVIYYEKGRVRQSLPSEVNYITGISRHLWFHKVKKEVRKVKLEENSNELTTPLEPTLNDSKLLDLLERTGKRCLDLLVSFYIEKVSLVNISALWNFSSEHSAAVQKYKCIEKVREVVKHHSISYEDFFE